MEWIKRTAEHNNAEFIILILLLLILGLMRQNERERLEVFIRSFVNPSLINQQLRQEKAFNRIAIPLFFTIVLILGFFLAQVFSYFDISSSFRFTYQFLMFSLFLLIITLIRGTLYSMFGTLFNLKGVLQLHTTNWLLNNFILALIVLPLSILITLGPQILHGFLIYSGIGVLTLFYLIRSIRLFRIVQQEIHVPLVYNVLYLCALEILPPILIGVTILRQVG